MNINVFFSILGLLTEMFGAFILIKSNLLTNHKKLQEVLSSIHGNRIREKDLDKNLFLNNLLCQSLEAQSGFIVLIIGLVFQTLGILIQNICSFPLLIGLIIIAIFLFLLYLCVHRINKKRREKAKKSLLNLSF